MEAAAIPERTTVGVFFRQAERLGDRTLVRHHDGMAWREVSWDEMRGLVVRVAARLVGEGIEAGDRVAIMSANSLEWLVCDLGIMSAGAVTVPIYPSSPTATTRQILENSQARLAFVANQTLAGRVAPLKVVGMDAELHDWMGSDPDAELKGAVESRLRAVSADSLCTIVYTSGTTGEPKGVMLAHRCLMDMATSALQVFDVGSDDQSLSFLPYAHVFERVNGIYFGLAAGASTWISRGINRVVEDLRECKPTCMVSVPRVYEKMHQAVIDQVAAAPAHRHALFRWAIGQGRRRMRGEAAPLYWLADRLILSRLRHALTGGRLRFFISGGAPLSLEVEEFFWSMGVKILQGWGMTETSSGACSNTERNHTFESVGPPLPGVEFRIADDGEILVNSPGNMLGYFRNPAATQEALVDGWVRTGDVGEIESDGIIRITDRKKDLIKTSGGKYVAPQMLEARLQAESVIERAIVIGEGRPYVVALLVPNWAALHREHGLDGRAGDPQAQKRVQAALQRRVDAVNRELGSWESVKSFAILANDLTEESGELTPTLKVRRRKVQERYADLIDALYERTPAQRRVEVT